MVEGPADKAYRGEGDPPLSLTESYTATQGPNNVDLTEEGEPIESDDLGEAGRTLEELESTEEDGYEEELVTDGGYEDPPLPSGDPGIDELKERVERGFPSDPLGVVRDEELESRIEQLYEMADAYLGDGPEPGKVVMADGGRMEYPSEDRSLGKARDTQVRLENGEDTSFDEEEMPLRVGSPTSRYEQEVPGEPVDVEVAVSQFEDPERRNGLR